MKSVGHEETFAARLPRPRRPAPPRGAHGRRRGDAPARSRSGGADRHRQGPLRRPRHHHPVPHRGDARRLPRAIGAVAGRSARRRRRGAGGPALRGVGVGTGSHRAVARQLSFDDEPAPAPGRGATGPDSVPAPARPPGPARRGPRIEHPSPVPGRRPGTRSRRRCRPSGPATATPRWARPPSWAGRGLRSRNGVTPSGDRATRGPQGTATGDRHWERWGSAVPTWARFPTWTRALTVGADRAENGLRTPGAVVLAFGRA